MEFDFAGEMCLKVDTMLESLKKVLFGAGLLTPTIHSIATALLSDKIPTEWTSTNGGGVGWLGPETSPQVWLRELVRKRIALNKWVTAVNKGQLLVPGSVANAGGASGLVLGDLFNPSTFINALRQQTARLLNKPIDQMVLVSSWSSDLKGKASKIDDRVSCSLANLFLQGASFHRVLQESRPEANEISQAPVVTIGFIDKTDAQSYSNNEDVVPIPVYLTPTREDFLMALDMPIPSDVGTHDPTQKWILAGVALFLSEE